MKHRLRLLSGAALVAAVAVAFSSTPLVQGSEQVVLNTGDATAAAGSSYEPVEIPSGDSGEKYNFQSDVSRTMKILVHSLYKAKEIFLRELISNASDALDKMRFLAVQDPSSLGDAQDLNVTVRADAKNNLIIITDTGVGMTKDDLIKNLGTIAKSGTAEFLAAMANGTDNHLIGQFGVGFYSAFLVADKVTVVSKNNADKQYLWESTADNGFSVLEDPRGNTLGRGTQIILHLRDDTAKEFLPQDSIKGIVQKYSEFVNFPIYLQMSRTIEEDVPLEEEEIQKQIVAQNERKAEREKKKEEERAAKAAKAAEAGEGAEVEDVKDETPEVEEPEEEIKTTRKEKRDILEWVLMNENKPIWTRDPKSIDEEDYHKFFKSFSKDTNSPMAYTHFRAEGDNEFRSLIYIPSKMTENLLQKADAHLHCMKLFVRRVFITDELTDFIPRYLNFVKGLVDSDNLPLSVSRESLQESRLLKVIKRKVIKKILDMISDISKDEEKYKEFLKQYGVHLKLGSIEDMDNQKKLRKLLRFHSSVTEADVAADAKETSGKYVSLEQYIERMKKGQEQIYYLTGASMEEIKKSPYLERVLARGFEVLYMTDPIDEYVVQNFHEFEGKSLQHVGKDGLKLGDEDKEQMDELEKKFTDLKLHLTGVYSKKNIDKVVLSHRLTTSASSIVANKFGWSGAMERLMNSQAMQSGDNPMMDFQRLQKQTFEINPRHPLIEKMQELLVNKQTEELDEVANILFETTALRSGYQLKDTAEFATLVEKYLRKNLNMDLSAQADVGEIAKAEEQSPEDKEKEKAPKEEVEDVDAHDEL